MKKQVLAVAVAVLAVLGAGSASATTDGAYAGAGVGASGVTKAWVGHGVTDNVSVEAGFTSFGSLSHKPQPATAGVPFGGAAAGAGGAGVPFGAGAAGGAGGVPFGAGGAVPASTGGSAFTAVAVLHADVGALQPFAKVGLSGSSVGNGLLAGVGIDYSLAGQWKARLEAERHAGAGVTTVTAGAAYTF